jgi:hypothetical protein
LPLIEKKQTSDSTSWIRSERNWTNFCRHCALTWLLLKMELFWVPNSRTNPTSCSNNTPTDYTKLLGALFGCSSLKSTFNSYLLFFGTSKHSKVNRMAQSAEICSTIVSQNLWLSIVATLLYVSLTISMQALQADLLANSFDECPHYFLVSSSSEPRTTNGIRNCFTTFWGLLLLHDQYKRRKGKQLLSDYCQFSMEAYIVLTYYNGYECWKSEVLGKRIWVWLQCVWVTLSHSRFTICLGMSAVALGCLWIRLHHAPGERVCEALFSSMCRSVPFCDITHTTKTCLPRVSSVK